MFIPFHDSNPLRHVSRPYVNWVLIAINCLVYALTWFDPFGAEQATALSFGAIPSVIDGAKELPALYELVPAPATLVTYAFLHADIWHLAGNMVFLWVFGDNVEDALGHWKYLAFYLLGAAFAGLTHVIANPTSDSPLIGASGAVAAIVAAYLILHPRVTVWILAFSGVPIPIPVWVALGLWILFQIYSVASHSDGGIAWWAHLGGLVAGAVMVVLFRRPGVALFNRPRPDEAD